MYYTSLTNIHNSYGNNLQSTTEFLGIQIYYTSLTNLHTDALPVIISDPTQPGHSLRADLESEPD